MGQDTHISFVKMLKKKNYIQVGFDVETKK